MCPPVNGLMSLFEAVNAADPDQLAVDPAIPDKAVVHDNANDGDDDDDDDEAAHHQAAIPKAVHGEGAAGDDDDVDDEKDDDDDDDGVAGVDDGDDEDNAAHDEAAGVDVDDDDDDDEDDCADDSDNDPTFTDDHDNQSTTASAHRHIPTKEKQRRSSVVQIYTNGLDPPQYNRLHKAQQPVAADAPGFLEASCSLIIPKEMMFLTNIVLPNRGSLFSSQRLLTFKLSPKFVVSP